MPELPAEPKLTPADLEAAYRAVWAVTPDEDLARGVRRFIRCWEWALHATYGALQIQHPWPLDLIVAVKLDVIQFWMSRCAAPDEYTWAMAAGHVWLRDGATSLTDKLS